MRSTTNAISETRRTIQDQERNRVRDATAYAELPCMGPAAGDG